jgi:hypothetical protein
MPHQRLLIIMRHRARRRARDTRAPTYSEAYVSGVLLLVHWRQAIVRLETVTKSVVVVVVVVVVVIVVDDRVAIDVAFVVEAETTCNGEAVDVGVSATAGVIVLVVATDVGVAAEIGYDDLRAVFERHLRRKRLGDRRQQLALDVGLARPVALVTCTRAHSISNEHAHSHTLTRTVLACAQPVFLHLERELRLIEYVSVRVHVEVGVVVGGGVHTHKHTYQLRPLVGETIGVVEIRVGGFGAAVGQVNVSLVLKSVQLGH